MIRLVLILLTLALPSHAEEVVLGLSKDEVAITATFDGSDILIFGAVKRDAPPPGDSELQVVITVAGPSEPITVRQKERHYGIWMNANAVEFSAAPSFYAVATSGPLYDVVDVYQDIEHKISVPTVVEATHAATDSKQNTPFTDALLRIREGQGKYQLIEDGVKVDQQTLFRSEITLPANLTEGAYKTRIFLTREGQVISQYETEIDVRKVGLERFLFNLSREQPVYYGLLSLAIAIFAGWGASAVFQLLRR